MSEVDSERNANVPRFKTSHMTPRCTKRSEPEVASCAMYFLFGGTPEYGRGTNLWLITRPRGHAGGRLYLCILTARIACEVVRYNVRNSEEIYCAAAPSTIWMQSL